MRHRVGAIIAIAVLGLLAGPAAAGTKILGGTYSRDTVKTDCDANGGTYSESANGYVCVGQSGNVSCNNKGKCSGSCQNCQIKPGSGLGGVLRPPPSSAGAAQPPASSGGKGTTKVGISPPASAGAKQGPSGGSAGNPVIEKQSGSGGKH
jgi:hypothetical protein